MRGVNLAARNRVSMPQLRSLLEQAGFGDVRTYLQSGNVVLRSDREPERVARACEQLLARELGLDVAVLVRTSAQLAAVVRRNPLGAVANDPKRYQVTFLAAPLPAATVRKLEAARTEPEQLVVVRHELYAWHPHGVARSRLWTMLAGKGLGVTATSRNWTTVEALHELASA